MAFFRATCLFRGTGRWFIPNSIRWKYKNCGYWVASGSGSGFFSRFRSGSGFSRRSDLAPGKPHPDPQLCFKGSQIRIQLSVLNFLLTRLLYIPTHKKDYISICLKKSYNAHLYLVSCTIWNWARLHGCAVWGWMSA